jgi:hypothetical protein
VNEHKVGDEYMSVCVCVCVGGGGGRRPSAPT